MLLNIVQKKKELKLKLKKAVVMLKFLSLIKGYGIPEEDLRHIFDRFYRTDKARTKGNSSGFGLGLSIAKKIIIENNGYITAESQVGKGSIFIAGLPAINS